MKITALLLLAACAGPAAAGPVHVALKSTASVPSNSDGFFMLGSVADVSGGRPTQRTRLAAIIIGRAPLSGEHRRVTRGDLALKLRQAGCDPDTAAVLEGADVAEVTATDALPVGSPLAAPNSSAPPQTRQEDAASGAPTQVIHRGDAVTILIQTGPLTITAPGLAREGGGAGQTIRVHRAGVMTDLSVQVLNSQTVSLEI